MGHYRGYPGILSLHSTAARGSGTPGTFPYTCNRTKAGEGKTAFVNQIVNLLNLGDIKGGVQAVVRVFFSNRLDEAFFLILPDAFLGEIHHPGDVIDEKEIPHFNLFVFSPGHGTV
jgi:hypothetical protein